MLSHGINSPPKNVQCLLCSHSMLKVLRHQLGLRVILLSCFCLSTRVPDIYHTICTQNNNHHLSCYHPLLDSTNFKSVESTVCSGSTHMLAVLQVNPSLCCMIKYMHTHNITKKSSMRRISYNQSLPILFFNTVSIIHPLTLSYLPH